MSPDLVFRQLFDAASSTHTYLLGDPRTAQAVIVEQISSLPDGCQVFPGHDYSGCTASSVAEEKVHNPRLGGGADERDFVGFMQNLHLPHPKQIDIALPANLRSGRPANGEAPRQADWGPVRQPEEMQDWLGRIAHAQVMPLSELEAGVGEVPDDKPVVAVCHAGMRSGQATVILRGAGRQRCANLRGGMLVWSQLGLPVEQAGT